MQEKYQQDLEHIKKMMEKSSRFISLSGLSGVVAGTIGLVGAYVAFLMLEHYKLQSYIDENRFDTILNFVVLALVILVSALGSGTFFTLRKSKRLGLRIWTSTSKQVLVSLAVPLFVGGIFCLALMAKGYFGFIAPAMLLFYGLALVNASKFMWEDIKYLGYLELLLGLISSFVLNYGLLFWAIGFGILHILYGVILYKKYN